MGFRQQTLPRVTHWAAAILLTAVLLSCPPVGLAQSISGEIVRLGEGILEVRLDGGGKLGSGGEVQLTYKAAMIDMLLGRYRVISVNGDLVRLQEVSVNAPAGRGMRVTVEPAGKSLEIAAPINLSGKVVRVSGKTIEIDMEGSAVPRKGDKVTLSFEVPGVGNVDLQGTWTVSEVGGGKVIAEPAGETGQPQAGQKARIAAVSSDGSSVIISTDNNLFSDTYGKQTEVTDRDIETMFQRGKALYYGSDGQPPDYPAAARKLREAAELGHAEAQVLLGVIYGTGRGAAEDREQARQWYQRAADQGNAGGLYNLGVLYAQGKGVNQDYGKALALFRQSAELGSTNAQYNLGVMYRQGLGTGQDYAEALKWFREGAEKGHAPCQHGLASMYENGYGVGKNPDLSIEWYRKAAAAGHTPALRRLKELGK